MVKKIWNLIKYGNYNNDSYKEYKDDVIETNHQLLGVFAFGGTILNFLLFSVSFYLKSISSSMYLYLLALVFSLLVLWINKIVYKYMPKWTTFLSYTYAAFLFIIYMIVGVNHNINSTAAIICGFYVLFPIFFVDKPYRYAIFVLFLTGIFFIDTFVVKDIDYALLDFLNCSVFALISILLLYYLYNVRMLNLVNKRKVMEERDTDYLTGLKNRMAIETYISSNLNDCKQGIIFFVDLDDFKLVNDKYGHAMGDKVLIEVAQVIERIFSGYEYARLGGDEFVIYAEGVNDEKWAKERASLLIKEISNIKISGKRNIVGSSIGIVFSNSCGEYSTFFDRVDSAMYEAKKDGKNCYRVYRDL